MGTLLLERPAAMPPAPPSLRPLDKQSPPVLPTAADSLLAFPPSFDDDNDDTCPLPSTTTTTTLPFNFSQPPQPAEHPSPLFTFELVTAKPHQADDDNPLKRRRRLTDVDGDGTAALLRKKRRLLKTLITSRLSTPYSYPATHIGDRGTNKAVHWARIRRTRSGTVAANLRIGVIGEGQHQLLQHHGGGGGGGGAQQEPMLRKAAILNRLRLLGVRSHNPTELILTAAAAAPVKLQLRSQEPGEAMRATDEPFVETTECRVVSPNVAAAAMAAAAAALPYAPLERSPLALSNYDALDLEDEWPDDEDGDGGGDGAVDDGDGDGDDDDGGAGSYFDGGSGRRRRESIYSDFSVFDSNAAEDEDDDDDHNHNTLGFSAMPH